MSILQSEVLSCSDLNEEEVQHLEKLVLSWGILADLSFSDLILYVPVDNENCSKFVIADHVRPTTRQSLYSNVLFGEMIEFDSFPEIIESFTQRSVVEKENVSIGENLERTSICIPVVYRNKVIAVLRSEKSKVRQMDGTIRHTQEVTSDLEGEYLRSFDVLIKMITNGQFPFHKNIINTASAIRAGIGTVFLDESKRITRISPNAMNTFYSMGFTSDLIGRSLEEFNIINHTVSRVYSEKEPFIEEVKARGDYVINFFAMPLLSEKSVVGAIVILRDVTEIRRLSRMVVSKDIILREVHHRVKVNLQTVSSLLDSQINHLDDEKSRGIFSESAKRIDAMALVHEILSRDVDDNVSLNGVLEPLVRVVAHSTAQSDKKISFKIEGESGKVNPSIAMPLAIVVSEILANTVEHAFSPASQFIDKDCKVRLSLSRKNTDLEILVCDNGIGLSDEFKINGSNSLGLSIIKNLVESQLNGSMSIEENKAGGACVRLMIPING